MNISSFRMSHGIWRGGRVVECTGLENQQGFTPFGGSNPPPLRQLVRTSIVSIGYNSKT